MDEYRIFYSEKDRGYIALHNNRENLSGFGETPEEALKELLIVHGLLVKDPKPEVKILRDLTLGELQEDCEKHTGNCTLCKYHSFCKESFDVSPSFIDLDQEIEVKEGKVYY